MVVELEVKAAEDGGKKFEVKINGDGRKRKAVVGWRGGIGGAENDDEGRKE